MGRGGARHPRVAATAPANDPVGHVLAAISISMGIFGINVVRWFADVHGAAVSMTPYVLGFQLAVVVSSLSVLVLRRGWMTGVALSGAMSLALLVVVLLHG